MSIQLDRDFQNVYLSTLFISLNWDKRREFYPQFCTYEIEKFISAPIYFLLTTCDLRDLFFWRYVYGSVGLKRRMVSGGWNASSVW